MSANIVSQDTQIKDGKVIVVSTVEEELDAAALSNGIAEINKLKNQLREEASKLQEEFNRLTAKEGELTKLLEQLSDTESDLSIK